MASIDEIYKTLKFRANKAGFNGNISPNDFNLMWPRNEQIHFNTLYKVYQINQDNTESLVPFKSDPVAIAIDGSGKYTKPNDIQHIDAIRHLYIDVPNDIEEEVEVMRVEDDRLANHLSSTYDMPTSKFPIYTEYSTYLQFNPKDMTDAIFVYLKKLVPSFWAYTLNGTIGTFSSLTGGTLYTNGTYNNILLTGGNGDGARANIVISGGSIFSVTITSGGNNYRVGDVLSATQLDLGGTGSGFSVQIATLSGSLKPVYDPANSIQPKWKDDDIDSILYLVGIDLGLNFRDQMLLQVNDSKAKENA